MLSCRDDSARVQSMFLLQIYMGGISQDVKRIFTLYSLDFLDHLQFFALMKITMRFKQLEVSHIMSWDSLC